MNCSGKGEAMADGAAAEKLNELFRLLEGTESPDECYSILESAFREGQKYPMEAATHDDPLWRVREGSMTALISDLARAVDVRESADPSADLATVTRKRLWLMETLATIAGVYLRNLVNPNVNDAQRAGLAVEYATIWLKELQAAVLMYEASEADRAGESEAAKRIRDLEAVLEWFRGQFKDGMQIEAMEAEKPTLIFEKGTGGVVTNLLIKPSVRHVVTKTDGKIEGLEA